jgi:uncharacterized membrane protein
MNMVFGRKRKYQAAINSSTTRWLTSAGGAALAIYGLRRWNKAGAGLVTLGLSLFASGIMGRDLTGYFSGH